jgi:uncharacterized protein (DUF58 family)
MAWVRVLASDERQIGSRHATGALDLARRLPRLALEARRIAAAVAHGIHGRRRPGTGETFWQFRPFVAGEAASRIDWRRSARDGHLYVREREWEAAHTVWLWIDRSPSMSYASSLAQAPKIDRALVIGLALADLLVRGGERVGHIGLGAPMASRAIVDRLADALAQDERGMGAEWPEAGPLPPLTEVVVISDALSPIADIQAAVEGLSARGARGHLLRIIDPVEETFPFQGQAELTALESDDRLDIGDAAEFRTDYQARMAQHGLALAELCRKRRWSLLTHRTDRPAADALLALATRISAGAMAAGG